MTAALINIKFDHFTQRWLRVNQLEIPSEMNGISFSMFGKIYRFSSNDNKMLSILKRKFSNYNPLNDTAIGDETENIVILFWPEKTNGYLFFNPDIEKNKVDSIQVTRINQLGAYLNFRHEENFFLMRFNDLFINIPETGASSATVINKIEMTAKESEYVGKKKLNAIGDDAAIFDYNEIIDFIIYTIARREKAYSIHAASLIHKNKGIILTAPSGTGKTTTALELTKKGMKYLSDEITIVKENENLISGITIPARVVKDKGINSGNSKITKDELNLKELMLQTSENVFVKPEFIFFLERDNSGNVSHIFTEIETIDALNLLTDQILNPGSSLQLNEQFDRVIELLNSCMLYRVKLGSDVETLFDSFNKIIEGIIE